LRQELDRQRPAIVQSFLFHANVVASLAAKPWPALRVVHGLRVADPRAWRHWVERVAATRADKVVCVSDAVARFARARSRIATAKIVTIANGVDCDFVDAQPVTPLESLGLASERRAIAALGRLDPQKGFDWLLDAAANFLPQLPQHDLIIVGDGPERAALAAQTQQLGIADRVYMPGWRKDAIGILKASDLFVMTSRWEGMPNALLEAMACSLPVVATRVEGVEEVVAEFPDRQLASLTDTNELVHRVVKLARDRALAEELAAANRWQIQQRFSLEQMIARYRQLYEHLLSDD
jgi:glycosyltransferase involved in cell wall biosynthesis